MADVGALWLASYPKSGNTWVRALLHAVEVGDLDLRSLTWGSWRGYPTVWTGLSLSDLSEVEALAVRRAQWHSAGLASDVPRRLKTHEAWLPAVDGVPACAIPDARALYIVRDPRDVVSSWAHHLGRSPEAAADVMRDEHAVFAREGTAHPGYHPASWSTHVTSWLDQEEVPTLVVRYESLIEDPVRETARMADWAGLPHDDITVRRAVERCTFEQLAVREVIEGFAEAPALGRVFFRRGRTGAWTTELDPALARRIEDDHGDAMRRLGYL